MLLGRLWLYAGLATLSAACASDPGVDDSELTQPGAPGEQGGAAADGPEDLNRAQLSILSDVGKGSLAAGEGAAGEEAVADDLEATADAPLLVVSRAPSTTRTGANSATRRRHLAP